MRNGEFRLRVRRENPVGDVDFVVAIEGDLDAARHIAREAIGYWALVDEVEALAHKSELRTERRRGAKRKI